jgi:hypothetical protein
MTQIMYTVQSRLGYAKDDQVCPNTFRHAVATWGRSCEDALVRDHIHIHQNHTMEVTNKHYTRNKGALGAMVVDKLLSEMMGEDVPLEAGEETPEEAGMLERFLEEVRERFRTEMTERTEARKKSWGGGRRGNRF